MGLVNRVVSDDRVFAEAYRLATKIAKRGPVAVRRAKAVIDRGIGMDVESGIELEAAEWARLFNTRDQKEGMQAFIAKRKPEFENR